MFGDRYGVAAAVVRYSDTHLAERGFIKLVGSPRLSSVQASG